jgi:hypothetical protein
VTIDLAPTDRGYRNHLYVMDGRNDAIRMFRPSPEALDGSWSPPTPRPVN